MEIIGLIMGMSMRVNFTMVNKMVKVLILGKTVMNTKEIGLMIKGQEKELTFLKMVMNLTANFTMAYIMVTGFILGKMVINTREIG
jgi:hypothetical protein